MVKPPQFKSWPRVGKLPYGPYMAAVSGVYDGDTFTCWVDIGMDHYPHEAIRIRDVWAKELNEEGGTEAKLILEKILMMNAHLYIDTEKVPGSEVKSFERYVAKVTLLDGRDLGTILIPLYEKQGLRDPDMLLRARRSQWRRMFPNRKLPKRLLLPEEIREAERLLEEKP